MSIANFNKNIRLHKAARADDSSFWSGFWSVFDLPDSINEERHYDLKLLINACRYPRGNSLEAIRTSFLKIENNLCRILENEQKKK